MCFLKVRRESWVCWDFCLLGLIDVLCVCCFFRFRPCIFDEERKQQLDVERFGWVFPGGFVSQVLWRQTSYKVAKPYLHIVSKTCILT